MIFFFLMKWLQYVVLLSFSLAEYVSRRVQIWKSDSEIPG